MSCGTGEVLDCQCDEQAGQRQPRQRPPEGFTAEPNLRRQAGEDEVLELFDGLEEEESDHCRQDTDDGTEQEQYEIASAAKQLDGIGSRGHVAGIRESIRGFMRHPFGSSFRGGRVPGHRQRRKVSACGLSCAVGADVSWTRLRWTSVNSSPSAGSTTRTATPKTIEQARERRARSCRVGDGELLRQQVRMLRNAPGPDHGCDRARRERSGSASGAAAKQDEHGDSADEREDHERQRVALEAVEDEPRVAAAARRGRRPRAPRSRWRRRARGCRSTARGRERRHAGRR